MKRSAWRFLPGAAVVLAGLVGIQNASTDTAAAPFSEATANRLINQDARNILDAVENATKKDARKAAILNASKSIHSNAMLMALTAHNQIDGKNAEADGIWAAKRDAAIKIALLGESKKFGDAAAAIKTPGLKADAKPKAMTAAQIAAAGNLDVEILMHQLKGKNTGGYGIEEKIQDMADADSKEKISAEEANVMAARLVTIADFFEVLKPAKGFSKNPKSDWDGYIKDMRTAAVDMASATKGTDAKAIKAAFQKLDASCISCHAKYK